MRIVIGTPRSARMSVSSSSSQSIGLPANCLARVSRNLILSFERNRGIPLHYAAFMPRDPSTPLRSAQDDSRQHPTLVVSLAHARGGPNLFESDREYRLQIGRNPRRRMPLPVRSPR